jgi:mono/diheme cytochrome c family protein
MSRPFRPVTAVVLALFALASCGGSRLATADAPSPEALEFFEKRIRPIFVEHCYECHRAGSKKDNGSLLLDSRQGLLKGGDSGPAIIVGDAEKSLLLVAVRQTDKDLRMPPGKKLTEAQIADLEAWVKSGAADPREAPANIAPAKKYGMTLEEGRRFWSFQPVRNPTPPEVQERSWPRTAIDHFILARLERVGVPPAAAADKRMLIRRATFDLTGLPPTVEEVSDFLADNNADAFEKVVDRLLASPRYGERWGRHWLDVVRYADTCGNASDYPVPQAAKYRDWVIRAFNADQPYDEFLRDQIAGDLLSSDSEEQRFERIVATGYLAIARRFGGDRMGEHHLTIEDTIDNLGRAVLGMNIACARCHDHKFDAFTTSDYYGLFGIFNSTRYPFPGAEVGKRQEDFVPLQPPAEVEAIVRAHNEQVAAIAAEVNNLETMQAEASKEPDSAEKKSRLETIAKALADARQRHGQAAAQIPAINNAYAVADAAPVNAKIHLRGDPKRLGEEVPRHFPAVLGDQRLPDNCTSSGRLQLAQWLTDRANPLPARVMVNRIWLHHFGKGLVATPNDFGRQGRAPSHPELLDFLATQFMANGWSVKTLHRQILLSHTWQLTSINADENARLDITNELFGRFTRRRLDAESLRDALLYLSGGLEEGTGAAHPFPPQSSWNWTQHDPFVAAYETRRRSVYLMQQRLRKNPYLALFDGADPSSSTGARLPSTTPLQALFLMNGPLAHQVANGFAQRIIAAAPDEPGRVEAAFQLAFNRPAQDTGQAACAQFLRAYREKLVRLGSSVNQAEEQAWSALARALLSGNEFAFVD